MWQGKRIYLIGAGKSGLAAARWLLGQGAQVCLNDKKAAGDFKEEEQAELAALAKKGLALELGADADPVGWDAGLVVSSPGVPLDQPILQEARRRDIPVTNEIELGWQISQARIVGITGSNGKTTTTSLIGKIMADAGFTPFVGGNIGKPFIEAAPEMKENDWAVLELSSFQLAGLLSLRTRIAIFLNLTPDHLDWHKTFDNYTAAKWNIARFQGQDDWLILNYDDQLLRLEGEKRLEKGEAYLESRPAVGGPKILWFSQEEEPEAGLYIDREDWIVHRGGAGRGGKDARIMPAGIFSVPGRHNRENLLAALGAGLALGISPYSLRQSISAFEGVEHRMEHVGEHEGVLYVNDSKATNPASAIKALDSYDRPILLIAGGDGKDASFDKLAEKVAEKAKTAVLIGRDRGKVEEALLGQGFSDIRMTDTLEEAVAVCQSLARPGDMILLSPACASLDMFSNFEERGKVFKESVKSLISNQQR
ncbi:MAG: UDP-N-acetylmuramoyl-L-alanine--D-glutamate ligase [Clostridiales bacterium]|nr:UDP-N-acetylmuramoyl-L-alanine--D-glutamate ligase [Clostridiales bacterium]